VSESLRQLPAFYISPPHDCGYLPGREAVTLFADPHNRTTPALYTKLAHYGFRRSGEHLYRPRCPGCQACVPTRLPVDDFAPNRSQRRNLSANTGLRLTSQPFAFDSGQFDLYRRYMQWRHPGSTMDDDSQQHYVECFSSQWCHTTTLTLHDDRRLVAVAITDRLGDALSAVYTFFDPDYAAAGLGTLALLHQIETARRERLAYLYLGYWIGASAKMHYKLRFRPLEWFADGRWLRLAAGEQEEALTGHAPLRVG